MRLDNFLKKSRLVKRRTLVREMCEGGAITVGGVAARPSKMVKAGDEVEISFWNRIVKVEVLSVREGPVSKKDSTSLYRVLGEEKLSPFPLLPDGGGERLPVQRGNRHG